MLPAGTVARRRSTDAVSWALVGSVANRYSIVYEDEVGVDSAGIAEGSIQACWLLRSALPSSMSTTSPTTLSVGVAATLVTFSWAPTGMWLSSANDRVSAISSGAVG